MADAWSHWTGPSSTTRTASIVRNAATDFAIAVNTTTRYCAPPWLALVTATPWRCVQSSCRRRTVTKNKTASPRPPIGGSRKTPGATPRCGRFELCRRCEMRFVVHHKTLSMTNCNKPNEFASNLNTDVFPPMNQSNVSLCQKQWLPHATQCTAISDCLWRHLCEAIPYKHKTRLVCLNWESAAAA